MTKDEWYKQLFERLDNSKFRSSFHLKQKDIDYINEKGLDTIRQHAKDFIAKREAPADYIRLIRLKRAAQLLSEGQYNISEISDMTGFNDVKYFREVFKKYYKISPSGYSKGEMKEEPAKP